MEIYISADRRCSTLTSLVWLQIGTEQMLSQYLVRYTTPPPPRRGVGRRGETNLLGSKAAQGGFRRGGREKQTDLFGILTGGGGFAAGGGGLQLEAEDLQLEANELQLEVEDVQQVCPGAQVRLKTLSIRENRFQPVD